MTTRIPALLAFALAVTGCMTEDPEELAATDQASSVLDQCATSGANASSTITYGSDSYTRQAGTINPSTAGNCDCRDWQADAETFNEATADANHPRCRPTTVVDFTVNGQQLGYQLGAEVNSWTLTNGKTECENSELWVKLQEYDYATGSYNTIWDSTSTGITHPTWNGTSCNPLGFMSPQGYAMSGKYRIRARATRGLPEFNHAYETIKIRGVSAF